MMCTTARHDAIRAFLNGYIEEGRLTAVRLAKAQALVDRSYQRELDAASRALINRIAANWDWGLFQPLVVARRRDGALFVVDGQHRLAAAIAREDVPQLPCVIFEPQDAAAEAGVFVELNQSRRPLTAFAIWKAALASGAEQALILDALLREAGLSFTGSADKKHLKPGQLNNVGAVRKWHQRHGDRRTRIVLTVLGRAFAGETLTMGSILLSAIGTVVIEHPSIGMNLLIELLNRPQEDWAKDFYQRAADAGIGVQAAAVAVLRETVAEALAEIADDTGVPAAAPASIAAPALAAPGRIDLNAVPSAMEQRAANWTGERP